MNIKIWSACNTNGSKIKRNNTTLLFDKWFCQKVYSLTDSVFLLDAGYYEEKEIS